jgi:6-pyruvoyl-tetrahydropterin synthase
VNTIAVRGWFAAGHQVDNHPYEASTPHGHDYELTALVEGDLDPRRWITRGSGGLPAAVRDLIPELHQRDLNKMIGMSTHEVLASWILERLAAKVPQCSTVALVVDRGSPGEVTVTASREIR